MGNLFELMEASKPTEAAAVESKKTLAPKVDKVPF